MLKNEPLGNLPQKGKPDPGRDPWDPWAAKSGIAETWGGGGGMMGGGAEDPPGPGSPTGFSELPGVPKPKGLSKIQKEKRDIKLKAMVNKIKSKTEETEINEWGGAGKNVMDIFFKHHGRDPRFVDHETRAHTGRTLAFKKWIKDRKLGNIKDRPAIPTEEVELDELSKATVLSYKKKVGAHFSDVTAKNWVRDPQRAKGLGRALDRVYGNPKKMTKEEALLEKARMLAKKNPKEKEKTAEKTLKKSFRNWPMPKVKEEVELDEMGKEYGSNDLGFDGTLGEKKGKDFQIHKDRVDPAIKEIKKAIKSVQKPQPKKTNETHWATTDEAISTMGAEPPEGTISKVTEKKESKGSKMVKTIYRNKRGIQKENTYRVGVHNYHIDHELYKSNEGKNYTVKAKDIKSAESKAVKQHKKENPTHSPAAVRDGTMLLNYEETLWEYGTPITPIDDTSNKDRDEKEPGTTGKRGKKPKLTTLEKQPKEPKGLQKPSDGKPGDRGIDGQEKGGNQPQAAAILKGGTTETGKPRDNIEIDPMMRMRPGQPDGTIKKKDKDEQLKKDSVK